MAYTEEGVIHGIVKMLVIQWAYIQGVGGGGGGGVIVRGLAR